MKRKLKVVPKPTKEEDEKLKTFIWMADWHFDETIKKECTEISSHNIYWDNTEEENMQWVCAKVYGLEAIKTTTKEPCIANIFIRYIGRVYQAREIVKAAEIIHLLVKEADFKEYERKLRNKQWKERQKLIKAKVKEKAKVRRLQVA